VGTRRLGPVSPTGQFSARPRCSAVRLPPVLQIATDNRPAFDAADVDYRRSTLMICTAVRERRRLGPDPRALGRCRSRRSGPAWPVRSRLVVTDYFLVEDLLPGGVVNVEGDHKIHVINVTRDHLELDRDFDVDFDRDISAGPARPHGVAMLPARNGCANRCD
jgi:hypothetical protein